MTAFVDVRYRGLRVAHKAKLLEGEGGVFVEHEQPLPVGSPLHVVEEGKDARPARVVRVVEHEAGAGAPGMRLTWDLPAVGTPAPAAAVPSAADVSTDSSVDASDDGSADRSSDSSVDRSTDGTVEAPVVNGNSSGKKSKKNKKRR